MKLDYSQWESVEELDDEELLSLIERITCQKEEADLVFDSSLSSDRRERERERDWDCYHRSLEMYLDIIEKLSSIPQSTSDHKLSTLLISCRLNSACCYSKVKKWRECVEICQSLLLMKSSLLTTLQQLRCHYFLANASFEDSTNETNLQSALQSSAIIQNMLIHPDIEIQEEDRVEYHSLHRKINLKLHEKNEGWRLLAQNRSSEALRWFADAIQRTPDLSESSNPSVLSNHFQGLGECYEKLSHYPKASMAFEKVVELTIKEKTDINQLDLLTQDTCQKFITKGAFNAFHAASILFLSTESITAQDVKEEFLSLVTRSIDLFQRLINFSQSSQLRHQFPCLTLYSIVGQYGLGCNFFLLSKFDQSLHHLQLCISQISEYLSSNRETQGDLLSLSSSPRLFLISESLFLTHGISLFHQPSSRYEMVTRSKQASPIKSFPPSVYSLFESFLSDLPLTAMQFPVRQIEQICYSFLFDSYIWSLYLLTLSKKYSDLIQQSDDFLCWIEKYDSESSAVRSHSLIEQLTLGNLILKVWGNNHLDCVDVDIQEYMYSSIFQHSQRMKSLSVGECVDEKSSDQLSHLFFICAEHYFQNSKIRLFNLDDKILHTDSYELSDVAQQVVEICSLAIKEYEKYIHQLTTSQIEKLRDRFASVTDHQPESDLLVSDSSDLLSQIHCGYIGLLRIHLWRGICGSCRIQGQRFFECGHSTREEYDKLRLDSRYQEVVRYVDSLSLSQSTKSKSQSRSNDLMETRPLWRNEYSSLCGDLSFHLAYTYMRSGKIKYAIEEGRRSVKLFESLTPLAEDTREEHQNYNSSLESDKKMKLRQAWGLVAVIACNMGENSEAREESQSALKTIKEMDVGPLQDSSGELAKLTQILELNRHRESASTMTPQHENESDPKNVLLKNWTSVNSPPSDSVPTTALPEKKSKIISKTISSPAQIDSNLLLSYFVLSSVGSFFFFLFVFALSPQFIS